MDIRPILKSQYHVALETLRDVIQKCPDAMWNDPADGFAPIWRVAYHALFFTDMYLRQRFADFQNWPQHRDEAQFIGYLPWDKNRPPKSCEPYTRGEILEYWKYCDDEVDARVDALDLEAVRCGFWWYEMSTLEHQIVNIRHVQHHAAALSSRLRRGAQIEIPWGRQSVVST